MTAVLNEVPRIQTWLRTVLLADATLNAAVGGRIYRGHAPQGSQFPCVLYAMLSAGDDVRGSGPTRIWAKPLYVVKAVGEGNNLLALQTIADRIDVVLHGVTGGSSSGVRIDYCIRKRPFYFEDVQPANKVYQHLGGEYELGVGAA